MNDRSLKTTVYRNERGCIVSDKGCTSIQLEFGNLFLRFDYQGLEGFKESIDKINIEKFTLGNKNKPYHRKIFLALEPAGITMALHAEEVYQLRDLLESAKTILLLKKLSTEALALPLN
ncbi:MAG: DUF6686 family protein [Chloroherpetonaceae bacterium]|nr:DUF6686 family protein [Chloroherpetonaceae bacterium]